ncbi:MAG: hypothetical protein ACI8Z9_001075 [Paraglaciecola sp.]|jgi:hypothetical protein
MISKPVMLLLLSLGLFSCRMAPLNTGAYKVLQQHALPAELSESSGLYCSKEGGIYTINDSGNEPVVYQLSEDGQIESMLSLSAKNVDWEAITGDQTHFYVADIGNNKGDRHFLTVYKYGKQIQSSAHPKAIEIGYKYNYPADNEYLHHDFDAEALVARGQHLVLFSKSWKSQVLNVYLLDKETDQQTLQAFATLDNLPGVVTGADFDNKNQRYVLVGYRRGPLGLAEPFVAVLNVDFELQYWHELEGFAQVEGVCAHPNGELWFTQEDSFFGENKLVKIQLASED